MSEWQTYTTFSLNAHCPVSLPNAILCTHMQTLIFPCFTEITVGRGRESRAGVFSSEPCSHFGMQSVLLATNRVVWGFPWPTTQLDVTQFCNQKVY